MQVEEKQKNVLTLLLTVIVIGFELSTFSNIIFTQFYSKNKIIFCIINLVVFIIALFLISYVTYYYEKVKSKSKLCIVYDLNTKKFIDIPYLPSTVRARASYDALSDNHKEKISKDFPSDEFFNFCNSFMVQFIFSLLFNNAAVRFKFKKYETVNKDFIKDLLVKFDYLNVDWLTKTYGYKLDENGFKLVNTDLKLPKGIKIKKVKSNLIRFKSGQGYLQFYWDIETISSCNEYIELLSLFKDVNTENCKLANIHFYVEYGYSIFRLFNKKTKELNYYFEFCKHELMKFDLTHAIERAKIRFMYDTLKNQRS